MTRELLPVSLGPHISGEDNTQQMMKTVCIALVPTVFTSLLFFGIHALLLLFVSVVSCVALEYAWNHCLGKKQSIDDFSAVVTGLLLGLSYPATLPYWMAVVGSTVAILVVKMLFGGLGYNFANPAIVGRIALSAGYASAMDHYSFPSQSIDVFSSATPLATSGNASTYLSLFLGNHGGSLGETSALAIILGGCYLIYKQVITPNIPLSYLGTVLVLSLVSGQDPIYQILSGGLLLAAFFMATDSVTSPCSFQAQILFGMGLGLLTCLIRFYGHLPEGVAFAILLMNLSADTLDQWVTHTRH